MCGIVGYVGEKDAGKILVKGLKRLEYRGYDSAGIALMNGQMQVHKGKGKVVNLEKLMIKNKAVGKIGIGHTRWATHGEPNDVNSHPHLSETEILPLSITGLLRIITP